MEERLNQIENKLNRILALYEKENWIDRMVLYRALQLKDKNQLTVLDSGTDGIKLGAVGGKVGLYGVTPVVKAAAIPAPSTSSALYSQAEAQSTVDAVNTIRTLLTNIGASA